MATIVYSVAGLAALLVGSSITNQVSNLLFSRSSDRKYADKRFGTVGKFFIGTMFDVYQLRRMEDQVLRGSDEAVMDFKSSHLSSIGQTSVASAILAQVGMTTMQLPGLDHVHWTSAGFLIASLLFGVVSIAIVCIQQQTLGMLNNASQVRLWLSTGRYNHDTQQSEEGDETGNPSNGRKKPTLQASVAALLVLRIPNVFLGYGIFCFLAGFGLYLGYAFRQDLQNTPGRDNNEAVMIFYLIVAAYAITQAGAATIWKLSETNYTTKAWEDDAEPDNNDRKNQRSQNGRGSGGEDVNEESPLLSSGSGSGNRNNEIREALEAMAKAHEESAKMERRLMELLKG